MIHFLNWPSALGTLNGLVDGGPVWFTELSSGVTASVYATCGNGDPFEYRLLVYSGPVLDPTDLYGGVGPWGVETIEIVDSVGFDSPLDFRSVAVGLV
jgi:hypothetical protein